MGGAKTLRYKSGNLRVLRENNTPVDTIFSQIQFNKVLGIPTPENRGGLVYFHVSRLFQYLLRQHQNDQEFLQKRCCV